MIKANELMIGNWVKKGGTFFQIEREDFAFHAGLGNLEDFEPIPLTPEILEQLKFGLRYLESPGKWRITSYIKSPLELKLKENGAFSILPMFEHAPNGGTIHDIRYVHELQNLYFAITRHELQIEL